MRVPLEITFRGLSPKDEIKELIENKAAKLERVADNLISCRVAVELKQKKPQGGSPFRVRVNLRLPPGQELVVDSGETDGDVHDELSTIVRDAFETAIRRLKKRVEKQKTDIKEPSPPAAPGRVVQLFEEDGYGFIQTAGGREMFFHRRSLVGDDFDRLVVGAGVRFVEETGEKGPHASTVQIVDLPNPDDASDAAALPRASNG